MLKEISEWSSVRKFKNQPIPKEKLISVMEAARRAPSWKNIQPWKFIAVTENDAKSKLANAFVMGGLIKRAPAVILCIGLLEAWDRDHQHGSLKELLSHAGFAMTDTEIDKMYLDSAISQSLANKPSSLMARTFENIGIAYGFMLMEAAHQGLGACIVGEIDNELIAVNNQEYNEIKKYFGLSETQVITAGIILGEPLQENRALSPRKASKDIYSFF